MPGTVIELGAWEQYDARMSVHGNTRRTSHLNRELRSLERRLPDSLSYTEAVIYPSEQSCNIDMVDGEREYLRNVAVINSDNLNEKMIMAMPGEEIENGSLVHWMDQYWLVTEQDANNTVYRRSKMIECNYLLKWINADHEICEQWCVIEDGTKYLTGEYEDRNFVITRGDSRIAITIAKNSQTAKLGRLHRFLVDDPDSEHMMAYALTKPLKFAGVYGGHGVYKFVLQEVNTTDDDNQELGIADYYIHFSHETDTGGDPLPAAPLSPITLDPQEETKDGRGNWL